MKIGKKLLFSVLFSVLLIVMIVSPAFAATVYGSCGGYNCSGTVLITSSGGSASTYYGTVGGLTVTLVYKYIENDTYIRTITKNASNAGTSVSASASKPAGGAYKSYMAMGTYNVYYMSAHWGDSNYVYY